ncbi:hypothetical protein FOZ63_014227, partial [Perkinsus olseni]
GKLKVAHFVRARRGPFTFDILERDRRLIWECNNFDRYYGSSFDKLATRRLEERILKVPFWHWRRVTLKSGRIDMIRMSRFIALRDFRERHTAQGDADQYSDPTKLGDILVERFDHHCAKWLSGRQCRQRRPVGLARGRARMRMY